MKLGAFSISLSVKDLHASKDFYEKIGFTVFAGDFDKNYFILKNGETLIGIFQGMFDENILTFNPGWDQSANKLASFEDIRTLQEDFKAKGLTIEREISAEGTGPANFVLIDPDGNPVLFDQHV